MQVKWAADNLDGYLNFYSVSGDGRVSNWTIVKTALWTNDTLLINFCKTLSNLGEESVTELLMGTHLEFRVSWFKVQSISFRQREGDLIQARR